MKYEVKVLNLKMYEYEGNALLNIENYKVLVAYQAPLEFIKQHINIREKIYVDFWLLYGNAKKVNSNQKIMATNVNIAGGKIAGEIVSLFSPYEFRIDCGVLIDIENDNAIKDINIGDYIEIEGTYQIYFPNTMWERKER